MCTECTSRLQAIETKLKHKKAARCSCKGGQHDYSNERCKLFPQKQGEKRWPGYNLEGDLRVSQKDWSFAERMRKRQKK